MARLAERLVAELRVRRHGPERPPDVDLLERVLGAAIEEGQQSFPEVVVAEVAYVDHLARLLDEASASQLAALHHAELWLCCACALGDGQALAVFEAQYLPLAEGAARSVLKRDHDVADAMQRLRTRLFTADGERPAAITSYAGRGPLSGWLRRIARNMALNMRRASRGEVALDEAGEHVTTTEPVAADAELLLLKVRFRPQLREAIAFAFARLAPDQKTLLRDYVVDGKTLEQIAADRAVAVSTVSRWLSRVRAKLGRDAKRRFAEETNLPGTECDSLIRVVTASMHLSVGRLLRHDTTASSSSR